MLDLLKKQKRFMIITLSFLFILSGIIDIKWDNIILAIISISIDFTIFLLMIFFINKIMIEIKREHLKENKKSYRFYKTTWNLLETFYKYADKFFLSFILVFDKLTKKIISHKELKELYKNSEELFHKIKEFSSHNKSNRRINIEKVTELFEELSKEINNFISDLSNSYESYFNERMENILDTIKKKNNFILEYYYGNNIVNLLLQGIENRISTVSEPMANQILTIKKNISNFNNVIMNLKEDMQKKNSEINMQKLISVFKSQNKDSTLIYSKTINFNNKIQSELNQIFNKMNKIFEDVSLIKDISEKIDILSLNASIEATRAGTAGTGFKVVANEIRKLSDNTKKEITSIVEHTNQIKQMVNLVVTDFVERSNKVKKAFEQQKIGLDFFYDTLLNFETKFTNVFNNFENMFYKVLEGINDLSPVFQLHEISLQRLSNAKNIINKLENLHNEIRNQVLLGIKEEEEEEEEVILNIINNVIPYLTTNEELKVLEEFAKKHGIKLDNKYKSDDSAIELF